MDPDKAREWVSTQIEEHAPTIKGSLSTATRLADAAAALRENQTSRPQVFGLAIPSRDVSYDRLYARCLEHLSGWSTVLDDGAKAELAAFMVRVGLPPCAKPTPQPQTVATLSVTLPVVIEDLDADQPTTAPVILRQFEGAIAEGGERLFDIACMRSATGGSCMLGGVYEDYGWAHGSSVRLAYDSASNDLSFTMTCELSRVPLATELERLLATITDELLMTSWGLNLTWDRAPTDGSYSVLVKRTPARHVLA